jgi:hypothetical protein
LFFREFNQRSLEASQLAVAWHRAGQPQDWGKSPPPSRTALLWHEPNPYSPGLWREEGSDLRAGRRGVEGIEGARLRERESDSVLAFCINL